MDAIYPSKLEVWIPQTLPNGNLGFAKLTHIASNSVSILLFPGRLAVIQRKNHITKEIITQEFNASAVFGWEYVVPYSVTDYDGVVAVEEVPPPEPSNVIPFPVKVKPIAND